MSHFKVFCLLRPGQGLRSILEPYSEHLICEPRIDCTKDEFLKEHRQYYKDDPEIAAMSDDEFIEEMKLQDYIFDENGNSLTTYNENSQWDWWSVGGRWSDILKLTPEAYEIYLKENAQRAEGIKVDSIVIAASGRKPGRCNAAKMKYLDFSNDPVEYERALRFWDLYVSRTRKPETEFDEETIKYMINTPEYFKERYGSRENYAESGARFSTWAVITPDGKWHQMGNVGWCATSDETDGEAEEWSRTFKERFIDTADPEWTAFVVDCHI